MRFAIALTFSLFITNLALASESIEFSQEHSCYDKIHSDTQTSNVGKLTDTNGGYFLIVEDPENFSKENLANQNRGKGFYVYNKDEQAYYCEMPKKMRSYTPEELGLRRRVVGKQSEKDVYPIKVNIAGKELYTFFDDKPRSHKLAKPNYGNRFSDSTRLKLAGAYKSKINYKTMECTSLFQDVNKNVRGDRLISQAEDPQSKRQKAKDLLLEKLAEHISNVGEHHKNSPHALGLDIKNKLKTCEYIEDIRILRAVSGAARTISSRASVPVVDSKVSSRDSANKLRVENARKYRTGPEAVAALDNNTPSYLYAYPNIKGNFLGMHPELVKRFKIYFLFVIAASAVCYFAIEYQKKQNPFGESEPQIMTELQ